MKIKVKNGMVKIKTVVPKSCHKCPFYHDGMYFIDTYCILDSNIEFESMVFDKNGKHKNCRLK